MLSTTTGVQPLYPNAHMSATTAASILLPSNQNNFSHFYTEHLLSTHLHWPGARKKQHKETLAIPHNFYGNLVELEHMVKSELPVGVVLPIDAKWTKTPTLWDALDYKKTGKCRIFYRHICIQDKYAIQEFV